MDFWTTIKLRRSVRNFDAEKKVPENHIKKILEAGQLAPSAGGMRDWHFEVIRDQSIRDQLSLDAMGQKFISQAPVAIIVCADVTKSEHTYGERGKNLYTIQDTAAATQNMLLAVTDLGLASCWVGAFDEEKVSETLKLSSNLRAVAILPVGYAK
ncbi:nitroreductase family protein [Patescibacteria group bacterium]|nr:nitroreductase family protein [Patescibacteria group bacterium]